MTPVTWKAPEFEYRPKDVSWYWISIIAAVLVLAAAIWQKNFLFAVFIIIGEILILVWANREPAAVEFSADSKGLTIGGRKFYAWSDMKGFGLVQIGESEWAGIIFIFSRTLKPPLRIPLLSSRAGEISQAIAAFIPEVEVQESAFDTLERFVRF